jgi:hypothetical protein
MATGTRGGVDILFPVRGTPGGWRDVWDDPYDSAELRAQVEAPSGGRWPVPPIR